MSVDKDSRLLDAVRAELDRSVAALDELTVARLRAARKRALATAPQRRLWLAAGGIAAGALAAGLAAFLLLAPPAAPPASGLEQLELLTEADMDLYDNLDFYRWLAEGTDAG